LQAHDGVSAPGLGLIIGFVASFKQAAGGVRGFENAHSDAQADLAMMLEAEFLLDPFRDAPQADRVGMAGDDDEFVSAETAGEVEAFAQRASQELSQILKGLVPAVMPVGVVELLEFVDVEKEESEGNLGAPCTGNFPFQQRQQVVAVEDLGQGVEEGLLPDFAFEPADGGYVAADHEAVVGTMNKAREDQFQLQVFSGENNLHFDGPGALFQEVHVPLLALIGHGLGELEQVASGQKRAMASRGKGDGPLPVLH